MLISEQNYPHQILLNRGFFMIAYIRVFKCRVCECYCCLNMVIQAHLHVGFFTTFFIKRASLKRLYLYLKLLQSITKE